MRDNSIKKTIIKIVYFLAVFLLTVMIIGHLAKGDHADMTATMPEATLPVITFLEGNKEINTMHGYISDIDVGYIRGAITPIDPDRSLSFKVKTFGEKVTDLGYEVRSVGNNLVESAMITDYKEDSDNIYANIQLKDLIDPGKEYMLIVFMNTDLGKAKYYTRFVWTNDDKRYNVRDELSFILDFSAATFDKDKAQEYAKYLETNSESDKATFSKVTIHSSFDQLTWGKLGIVKHTDPEIYITDLHEQTGCYELQYRVRVQDGTYTRTYDVTEDFRVRYTTDRLYLLDYERHMDYVFDSESYSISPSGIFLGISNHVDMKESSSGSAFAFVSGNRLYSYNNTENKLAYLFGFFDEKNDDIRTRWNRNSIKILTVDEAGNIKFAVSGYMNRGIHEGQTGIAVYDYDASINAVEEQAFVEINRSPELIMSYVDKLAYASGNDIFYVMIDQDIYEIDLLDRTANAVVEDVGSGTYKISESGSTIAWQGEDLTTLSVMNLNTRAMSEVKAEPGEYIIVLDFTGEDLVYGAVRPDDIKNDQMGNPIYAMYSVKIQSYNGDIAEDYRPDDGFVTSVSLRDDLLNLTLVKMDAETGSYVPIEDDQIMLTLEDEKGSNLLTTASVEKLETITQISTKSEIKVKELRVLTPNQTLYEGDRKVAISLERDVEKNPLYYVYDIAGNAKVYTDPAKAVKEAERVSGVVVGDSNRYVWYKGNRLKSNQIMALTRIAESYEGMTEKDSTAVCIDLMLQFEGVNRNIESLLSGGKSVGQILEESLPEADVIDLDGCSLSSILYYVNKDLPVMAKLTNGDAVLVIGFNDLNTVLVNPKTGSVYKYGMNDSEKLFEENGNHFITYITEDK